MILERSDEKTPFELGVCAHKKSGCMSRLLMRSGRYCRTTEAGLRYAYRLRAAERSPGRTERRVMGLVVALVAQLVQARFEIRLVLGQFKRRQHAAVIGAVAAVVEQGDVPVRAQRVQEFQQRTR